MNKTLKNLIVLESNVKIYVPGTINKTENFDNTEYVNKTYKLLSDFFIGCTSYEAIGHYILKNTELINENITVCESYCKEADLKKHISAIIDYCEDLKKQLSQEAISLKVNNKLYFV